MQDNISVALTFKNRAKFLDWHLHYLVSFMDYDMKKVEICITDGYSTDNLFEIIEKWSSHFYQIKYAISDRGELPFAIPSNNPACDINTLICNVVTFEKIIKTDPEVIAPTDSFKKASTALNDKDTMLWYCNHCLFEGAEYNYKSSRTDFEINPVLSEGGLWHAFNKTAFIEMNGIEEGFAMGHGFEDMHFRYMWERRKKLILNPQSDGVVYHFHHGYDKSFDYNQMLLQTVSAPLLTGMLSRDEIANLNNNEWQRPEMIKDIRIFK